MHTAQSRMHTRAELLATDSNRSPQTIVHICRAVLLAPNEAHRQAPGSLSVRRAALKANRQDPLQDMPSSFPGRSAAIALVILVLSCAGALAAARPSGFQPRAGSHLPSKTGRGRRAPASGRGGHLGITQGPPREDDDGAPGPRGATGARGSVGPRGEQGLKGVRGETGAAGPRGRKDRRALKEYRAPRGPKAARVPRARRA